MAVFVRGPLQCGKMSAGWGKTAWIFHAPIITITPLIRDGLTISRTYSLLRNLRCQKSKQFTHGYIDIEIDITKDIGNNIDNNIESDNIDIDDIDINMTSTTNLNLNLYSSKQPHRIF